ncbi:PP2C family protein-serine/threonine phosphatase [Streptomyces sp. NPDC102274]|uniref:PP2C family protein-serine/threonine phosphatase n=1 Tax=Streptomyces sp. NPDC102274 TaxID=3366151 RepID=UPI0038161A89
MTRRRPSQSASADDLLRTLGRLTAQARRRVELQHARVELAEALQRAMVPPFLPAVPGLRTAARYAPARDGLDIGGDWYDGFLLPDGTLAFCVGDVQGHDVEAAVIMGQVRIGLRAVAAAAGDPGQVLSRANDLMLSVDSTLFATCTFLRFDPATRVLESARAGHVASVWALADGSWGVDEDPGGLPLGILPGERYPVIRRRLTDTGAFVVVTDGVVEGPSFPVEAGLERVARLTAAAVRAAQDAHIGADPGELATRVLKVADLTGHLDDAAVLVLCHDSVPNGPVGACGPCR